MSFLSIVLVASAFYFAHARPDSPSGSKISDGAQGNGGGVEHAPVVPPESSVPVTNPKDYEHKLFGVIQELENAAPARPDSPSGSEISDGAQGNGGGVEHAPVVPPESSVPVTNPKDYEHKLFGVIQELENAAHARPDSPSGSETSDGAQGNGGGVEHAPVVPPESSVPVTNPKDYEHKLFGFIQELENAVNNHITPLMSKLDVKKQDELKSMCMSGFISYVNYVVLIADLENKKAKGGDQFLLRDDIILEFEYPLDPEIPYMAITQD